MRRRSTAVVAVLAAATSSAFAPEAVAVDLPEVAGEPVTLDVTNTFVLDYHFDNRNDTPADVSTQLDDHYGEMVDRLNLQLGWWRLRFGARLDSVLYFEQPDLEEARALAGDTEAAEFYYRDLATRYRSTIYPSKLWLTYTQPGIEATVGDFYAQLGRGFVLSVRKIDDLSIDTTIRGGKVTADHDFGPLRVGATLLAGQMNPLRVDETTGRWLTAQPSPLFFGFPRPNSVIYYRLENDPVAGQRVPVRVVDAPRPSYYEDSVIGGHLEAGNETVLFGLNGSLLFRKSYAEDNLDCSAACEVLAGGEREACLAQCREEFPTYTPTTASKLHETIRTFSGSVTLPNLGKHGDLYVEVAGQQLRDGQPVRVLEEVVRDRDLTGYAVYGAGTVRGGPVSVSLEGKHYRRFFPLSANVDDVTLGFSAPGFQLLTYNSPPTAEPIYVEPIGAPQVCNTGGRARVDYRFTPHLSVYGWLGHYVSFSEIDAVNNDCSTEPEKRTNTWDGAVGTDASFETAKSHVKLWIGAREDNREVPAGSATSGVTPVFYREGYVRYDLTKHIGGPFAVQAIGFHRRRYEPVSFGDGSSPERGGPWFEGENYAGLQWAPHFTGIFGYEYSNRLGCAPGTTGEFCHYVNGGLQYKSASSETALEQIFDTVTFFIGQRRGAIRCVSGVCRLFPPFEGAKIEVVSRF
jgi:hypothetical protein